jgi:hypothetical protein
VKILKKIERTKVQVEQMETIRFSVELSREEDGCRSV